MSDRLLICDIDGVIADLEHRLHYIEDKPVNWDGFFEDCVGDKPIEPVSDGKEFVQTDRHKKPPVQP